MTNQSPVLFLGFLTAFAGSAESAETLPSPNGLTIPPGYENWQLVGVSHRTENNTLRAILGNDAAIKAAREANIRPWPDGAILAKVVWKQKSHASFPTAIVPGELTHVEFMFKDSARFAATGGWGFARWLGEQKQPYGQDASFAQECLGCHTMVKDKDWVFTAPVKLP